MIKQSNIFRIDGVDIQPRMQWKVDSDKGIALVYNDDLIWIDYNSPISSSNIKQFVIEM